MTRKIHVLIGLLGFMVFTVKAQHGPFESWSAGINAGLYGAGIQGATSLSPNFKLRAGFDFFTYSKEDVAEFDVDVEYGGYEATATAELTDIKVTFPNWWPMLNLSLAYRIK